MTEALWTGAGGLIAVAGVVIWALVERGRRLRADGKVAVLEERLATIGSKFVEAQEALATEKRRAAAELAAARAVHEEDVARLERVVRQKDEAARKAKDDLVYVLQQCGDAGHAAVAVGALFDTVMSVPTAGRAAGADRGDAAEFDGVPTAAGSPAAIRRQDG